MKFAIGILLAGIGYAAFDPTARSVVMSQPTNLIIFEYICAHVIIAAFVGMEFYAGVTADLPKKQWSEFCVGSLFLGVFWPATVPCYYVGRYVVGTTLIALGHHMTAWTAKRREARKKMS